MIRGEGIIMTLETALILAIAICLLTVKPGPGMLAVISRALADGFMPAFFIALGIVTIQVFFFSLSIASIKVAGGGDLDTFSNFMKALAAAYMFFLGVKGLMTLDKGVVKQLGSKKRKRMEFFENYGAGVMITLSNPFVILFYAAVVPAILQLDTLGMADTAIALVIIAGLNLGLLSTEALLAAHIRESLKDKGLIRNINLFTSLCFLAIGAFLVYSLLPFFQASLGFGHN